MDVSEDPPSPTPSSDTAWYWEATLRHELLVQRCGGCGAIRHPPSPGCAACGCLDWSTVRAATRGQVHSFIVPRYPEFRLFRYPYVVAVVELADGVRVVANLRDVAPETVSNGMLVDLFFEDYDGFSLPQFRPAEES